MDNLTHSLVGAVIGRMGAKRLTPYAMPALILSANLPDIDSFVAPLLGAEPIAVHRGFTHGIGGWFTMPFLAAAIILLWQRFRSSKEGQVRLGGLLIACFLGTISHPALDFLNTYGTRVAEPLNHRWYYGDTLFIIDPWIWVALILGLELSWRAERLGRDWTRPAVWAAGAVLGYVALNAAISVRAVAVTRPLVERVAPPRMIVAGEVPLTFWRRRMIWRGDAVGGFGTYNVLDGLNSAWLDPRIVSLNLDDPRLAAAAERSKRVRGFLFWSRMPMVHLQARRAYLTDQRFFDSGRASSSNFRIPLDKPPPGS